MNQISNYGVVADLSEEFIPPLTSTKNVAMEKSDSLNFTCKTTSGNQLAQGNLLQDHNERVENLPDDDQLKKLCSDAGFIKKLKLDSIL